MAAIRALKGDCVILALNYGKGSQENTSPVAVGGFNSKKAGNTIPHLVITSPDQTILYEVLSYKDLHSRKKISSAGVSALEKIKDRTIIPPIADAVTAFNFKGSSTYHTFYVGSVIDESTFMGTRKKGGAMRKYKTNQYSLGAKAYIKKLYSMKGAKEKAILDAKIKALMPKLVVEDWTSAKGKAMKGIFVSLENGEITLEIPKKSKPLTFSIGLLNADSKKRANELAGLMVEARKKAEAMKPAAK